MSVITAVRQTQLPVFISLCSHGIDRLPEKFLRRVVEGDQDADLQILGKYGLFLQPAPGFIRKALRSEVHTFDGFAPLLAPAPVHAPQTAVMDICIFHAQEKMNNDAQGLAGFPVPGIAYTVKTLVSVGR